jgi:hypothetical protein
MVIGIPPLPPMRRRARSERTASEESLMVMPAEWCVTRTAACIIRATARACEQLSLESVGRDDKSLGQQLLLESFDEVRRAVAFSVVTKHLHTL